MDFIDEEHVAFLQRGQKAREVACLLDHRAGGGGDVGAHGLGHDEGQRRFAETRRAAEEQVLDRIIALFCGGNEDVQPVLDPLLTNKLIKQRRPQGNVQPGIGRDGFKRGFGRHDRVY